MTAQDQFNEYHAANPKLWELLVKFTKERLSRGHKVSVQMIFERIRWETDEWENSNSGFKISHRWKPYYARKFMQDYPEHAGCFRTRRLRAL
jgi:hypothetical protein